MTHGTTIVHAVNPPGYRPWAELVLPMMDNTVAGQGLLAPWVEAPAVALS